ncbi:N(6)-adenine-specific methyltransferase METTL4 [Toxorhynchites rutilus septentrionalis]|uniref:N(6)-adenine-specific methyltransferase METTL4 n=1 Tax=Toxorhynchites rutilus septentrionalis TaxID=329112 RepID=UPI002479B3E0|nr:N(6)-adenine-specific methyltransferase METTL4 [Toxorhynchites rutilus septentrionalis]
MADHFLSDEIVYIEHKACVDKVYASHKFYDASIKSAALKSDLFQIVVPYDDKHGKAEDSLEPKPKKRKKALNRFDDTSLKIQRTYVEFLSLMEKNLMRPIELRNTSALEFVDAFTRTDRYDSSAHFEGANNSRYIVMSEFSGQSYLIPPNCRFFNTDISKMAHLPLGDDKFDFIVIDPPWWNKYIRRVKAANSKVGYSMLDNETIQKIPLEKHIHDYTIVVIWCTNSPTHINAIKEQFLKKWKLRLVGNWYWIKITKSGQPVCNFNESNKKQPYEQIFIATSENNSKCELPYERFLYSVPSALHSNKPPLLDIFHDLLPDHPKCLEIFARNVYPNFTSIGTEVLKLQNVRLFDVIKQES